MKKLFFAAAAAAMVMGVSCTESTPDNGNASITVRISGPSSSTRAIETPADENPAPMIDENGTHFVYVISGGTIVHSEPLTAITEGSVQPLAGGAKQFSPNSQVYILANIPANTTGGNPANFGSMTSIENAVSAISYAPGDSHNTSYEYPAMGNYKGIAAGIGSPNESGVATAAVSLEPLFARVELQGIEGGEWIKSFTVKNVYIDEYYSSFSMTGEGSVIHSMGQAATIPADQFGNEVATGSGEWDSTDTDPVTAGEGKVWAYHVGGGSLVRFIIELEDVIRFKNIGTEDEPELSDQPEEAPVEGPTFVTVMGYTGQTGLTQFDRGRIYSISPIVFNKVGPINDDMVAITANVTIKNWVTVKLDPIATK